MRKLKKSEQILLILLAVVLVIFIRSRLSGGNKKSAPPAAVKKIAQTAETAAARVGIIPGAQEEKIPATVRAQFAGWGRDPFRGANRLAPPDTSAALDSTEIVWKGLLRTDKGTLVMIGPYVLAEGERQGDLQVLKIERDFVICRYRGKRLTLFRPEKAK